MLKLSAKKNRAGDFAHALEARENFKNDGGTLSGVNSAGFSYGRLSEERRQEIESDAPTYVVYSYATPIAWLGWRGWKTNPDRYSVTTSQHQGKIFAAIATINK